jgi:hypothetical protein
MREKVMGKLLALDRSLEPSLPAFLALLDASVEDGPWEALDPPQRRQRTLEAIKRLLLREAQDQPLLLVFEDLHWIDAETQGLLDSLIEGLPTARVLLLVNYRPEYQHGWGSRTFYTQLRLDPLPPEGAEALLHALLGDDATLRPLPRLLIERTEGNPFFLEESVRTLVETHVLIGERGAYRLVTALPTIQVPTKVYRIGLLTTYYRPDDIGPVAFRQDSAGWVGSRGRTSIGRSWRSAQAGPARLSRSPSASPSRPVDGLRSSRPGTGCRWLPRSRSSRTLAA